MFRDLFDRAGYIDDGEFLCFYKLYVFLYVTAFSRNRIFVAQYDVVTCRLV